MDKWKNKIALVTGASFGIGAGIADRLVKEGLQVIGLARKVEIIEERAKELSSIVKTGKLYALKCDITQEEEVLKTFKWIEENIGTVQILINNAAIMTVESITDGTTSYWKKITDTCIFGMTLLTRETVQGIRKNNLDGQIININSRLGHYIHRIPGHNFNLYPCVKYAMTAFNEVMTQEMEQYNLNIRFTSLSPGMVSKTNIFKTGNAQKMDNFVQENSQLQPEDLADAVVYILSTPNNIQIYELMIKSFNFKQ